VTDAAIDAQETIRNMPAAFHNSYHGTA